jgi:hypothetical protein
MAVRVTRLGEFSPLGRLLTLGFIFENSRGGKTILAPFFHGKSCVLMLTENGLGHILGTFFTNLSGHPDGC